MTRLTFTEIFGIAALVLLVAVARSTAAEATPPIRVATLLPFVEDALELAPDRAIVVASVRRSMHAPLDPQLIDLGNPHSPNFERLAEATPQLIIGDLQIHAALAPRLEALGAEVQLIDTAGVEATLESLSQLSERIGKGSPLEARIAATREAIGTMRLEEPIDVLPLFGAPGTFYAITERAWLGQLLSGIGFRNLAPSQGDERFPGLVVVSDEVLATLEPDMVVLVAHGDPRKIRSDLEQRTQSGGAWSSLGSASHGIHILDPRLFSANPGLDLDRAARELISLAKYDANGVAPATPSVSSERASR